MTMKEATLAEWKVKEGDAAHTGDVVLVIETDKTKWEVEAAADGLLHIVVDVDQTVPVGTLVGLLADDKDELASLQKDSGAAMAAAASEPEPEAEISGSGKPPSGAAPGKKTRVKASPVAKKLAEKRGIDLSSISGTGPGGRITKDDVLNAAETAPAASGETTTASEERDGIKVKEIFPLRGMRKAISDHMHQSLAVSAQLTATGEIEATELKKLRTELVKQEAALGTRITYTDICVLAAAKTLRDVPAANASLIDNEIILWEDINIGVAVALEGGDALGGGLIVPVIRNADKKSLTEISKELKASVEKARDGKLMPDDVSGGTFTITNLSALGGGSWGYGTPIINQPQSAILGTGAISDRAVVREGEIVIRPMMPISFTFDHRVLDGAPAGVFSARFSQLITNPYLLIC